MIKKLFKNEKEYIDFLWGDEETAQFAIEEDEWYSYNLSRENDSPKFGVDFLNKYDVTDNPEDDGEWAGKEHYEINEDIFPEKFPVVITITIAEFKNSIEIGLGKVYLSDFKK